MATSRRKISDKDDLSPKLHLVTEDSPTAAPAETSSLDRAEVLVDHLSAWGKKSTFSLLRLGARFKEEVEDLWAEAKSVARSRT